MSLIVAKKENNNIFIVSDTKLSNPENLNRMEMVAPEEFSAIKTVIINPFICISFAGDVQFAKKAISNCRRLNDNIEAILNRLLAINIESENETEFIVAISLHVSFLYEIKKGKLQQTTSAWIGNNEGFNGFQQSFLSSERIDTVSKMEEAMAKVIESNVSAVNGFIITVTNDAQLFSYRQYIKTYIPSRTYTGSSIIEVYGTVHEGGYTVNFYSNQRNDVVAIHVRQNRYGLIYANKDDGYLEPSIHKDVDEHEFNEVLEANYGFKPLVITSSKQLSYFERGNKAAEKREFSRAVDLYNLGLKEKENLRMAELHFNKGVCQLYLGQFQNGINSFNEALRIDRNYQTKVFQVLKQFRRR